MTTKEYKKHLKQNLLTEWKLHLINSENYTEKTASKYVAAIVLDEPPELIVDKFVAYLVAAGLMEGAKWSLYDPRGIPRL